ncbi:MAG: hypothetical protein SNJ33_03835 [Rikenellaceae bacterium]
MYLTEITTVATAIVAALTGGVGLLFLRERKVQEQLKNELTLSGGWQEMAINQRTEVKEKDAKIHELYKQIGEWRERDNEHTTRIAVLELQRCDVNGCAKRQPPRGF